MTTFPRPESNSVSVAYYELRMCTEILPSAMLKMHRNILVYWKSLKFIQKIFSVISSAEELGMRKENRSPYWFCLSQNFSEYNLNKQKNDLK